MQTCSVAPASDFSWGKSLPSSQHNMQDNVCDVILKTGPRNQDIKRAAESLWKACVRSFNWEHSVNGAATQYSTGGEERRRSPRKQRQPLERQQTDRRTHTHTHTHTHGRISPVHTWVRVIVLLMGPTSLAARPFPFLQKKGEGGGRKRS